MPFAVSTRSRTELNLEILVDRRSDDGSIVLTSFGGTGTNSMEIVFDSANGIGSNSFVSAEGCQLLFFRSCRLID